MGSISAWLSTLSHCTHDRSALPTLLFVVFCCPINIGTCISLTLLYCPLPLSPPFPRMVLLLLLLLQGAT
jgi:hypothetical protein